MRVVFSSNSSAILVKYDLPTIVLQCSFFLIKNILEYYCVFVLFQVSLLEVPCTFIFIRVFVIDFLFVIIAFVLLVLK